MELAVFIIVFLLHHSSAARGNVNQKQLPLPTSLSTPIPRCRWMPLWSY